MSRTLLAQVHGIGNLIMLVFFAMSWAMREYPPQPPVYALVRSFLAGGITVFTGWLGGELVDRLGIGVDPGRESRCAQLAVVAPADRRIERLTL